MTTVHPLEAPIESPCFGCGYDLRAHPRDGQCPECGASVAESIRLAAIPRRPAWRDSDPAWRRRMLAGVWLLVLMPAMDMLQQTSQSAIDVEIPTIRLARRLTLGDTFLHNMQIFPQALFCMGVVLLFARERNRRKSRLDWTRCWGILCSYATLLLCAAPILNISALVLAGFTTLFNSMPLRYQPGVTPAFSKISTTYLRYGPQPKDITGYVLIAFASITILLAYVSLFNALCSSGRRRWAMTLVVPLGVLAILNFAQAGWYAAGIAGVTPEFYSRNWYFRPLELVIPVADLINGADASGIMSIAFVTEATKWCTMLAIAVWLSAAQIKTWFSPAPRHLVF